MDVEAGCALAPLLREAARGHRRLSHWGSLPEKDDDLRAASGGSALGLDGRAKPADTAGDFASVGYAISNMLELMAAERWQRIAAQGLAESMSPLIIGGAFLALGAFFSAVGAYRMEQKRL